MTNKKTEKPTTEANAEVKAPTPKPQSADKPSIEVLIHSPGLEISGRRDEVSGNVTTIHLEVGPARERYPDAAYPAADPEGEEVTPADSTDDQAAAPATEPES